MAMGGAQRIIEEGRKESQRLLLLERYKRDKQHAAEYSNLNMYRKPK